MATGKKISQLTSLFTKLTTWLTADREATTIPVANSQYPDKTYTVTAEKLKDLKFYANQASFPATGEADYIYVDTSTNPATQFYWNGSSYIPIGSAGTGLTNTVIDDYQLVTISGSEITIPEFRWYNNVGAIQTRNAVTSPINLGNPVYVTMDPSNSNITASSSLPTNTPNPTILLAIVHARENSAVTSNPIGYEVAYAPFSRNQKITARNVS